MLLFIKIIIILETLKDSPITVMFQLSEFFKGKWIFAKTFSLKLQAIFPLFRDMLVYISLSYGNISHYSQIRRKSLFSNYCLGYVNKIKCLSSKLLFKSKKFENLQKALK